MGTIWAMMKAAGSREDAERFLRETEQRKGWSVEVIYHESEMLLRYSLREVLRALLRQAQKPKHTTFEGDWDSWMRELWYRVEGRDAPADYNARDFRKWLRERLG